MTWAERVVKSCLQSARTCLVGVRARLGISRRTCATQLLKLGGSLGTITGAVGLLAVWLLAATNIQCLNAWVVIGFPATSATELPGIPDPHPASTIAATKKAPSAGILLDSFLMGALDGSESP